MGKPNPEKHFLSAGGSGGRGVQPGWRSICLTLAQHLPNFRNQQAFQAITGAGTPAYVS
jgi:hypothetical protein